MIAKTNIKPLFDNVLVRPNEAMEKTASGILLPESVKEKPQIGKVMAVGDGAAASDGKVTKVQVKVGQEVYFKKWGGNEVKVGDEEWVILKQEDILAVVEK